MNNPIEPILQAHGVHRRFHDGARELAVLRGIDLEVKGGEAVAIVGVSGAGKSTLLHLLAGLDRPTAGKIELQGQSYQALSDEQLARVRARSIGIVYQAHHLLPEFTALENVMLAGLIAGARPAAAEKQARARLAEVGLADRLRHRPSKLSGGERQRTALARALINEPALVLADEPTGSLDAASSRSAIDLLWKSTLANQRALVIVTHEPAIASRANRILRLEDGRLFDCTGELKSA